MVIKWNPIISRVNKKPLNLTFTKGKLNSFHFFILSQNGRQDVAEESLQIKSSNKIFIIFSFKSSKKEDNHKIYFLFQFDL